MMRYRGHLANPTRRSAVSDSEYAEPSGSVSDADRALAMIREATDHALDEAGLVEAVAVLISQRDNARHYAETFRAKLKELGFTVLLKPGSAKLAIGKADVEKLEDLALLEFVKRVDLPPM